MRAIKWRERMQPFRAIPRNRIPIGNPSYEVTVMVPVMSDKFCLLLTVNCGVHFFVYKFTRVVRQIHIYLTHPPHNLRNWGGCQLLKVKSEQGLGKTK